MKGFFQNLRTTEFEKSDEVLITETLYWEKFKTVRYLSNKTKNPKPNQPKKNPLFNLKNLNKAVGAA